MLNIFETDSVNKVSRVPDRTIILIVDNLCKWDSTRVEYSILKISGCLNSINDFIRQYKDSKGGGFYTLIMICEGEWYRKCNIEIE